MSAGTDACPRPWLHGPEEALTTLGCTEARQRLRPRVLVGGLGMGFTTVRQRTPSALTPDSTTISALPPPMRCLDLMMVVNEVGLRRVLASYVRLRALVAIV